MTYRLLSGFDFWDVDMHEWKEQGSLTGFLKKFSFEEKGHFGPKNCHPHNSGSVGRILNNAKDQYVNEGNDNGLYLKAICSGLMDLGGPENGTSS